MVWFLYHSDSQFERKVLNFVTFFISVIYIVDFLGILLGVGGGGGGEGV